MEERNLPLTYEMLSLTAKALYEKDTSGTQTAKKPQFSHKW